MKPKAQFCLYYLKFLKIVVDLNKSSLRTIPDDYVGKILGIGYLLQTQFIGLWEFSKKSLMIWQGLDLELKLDVSQIKLFGNLLSLIKASENSEKSFITFTERLGYSLSFCKEYGIKVPNELQKLTDSVKGLSSTTNLLSVLLVKTPPKYPKLR